MSGWSVPCSWSACSRSALTCAARSPACPPVFPELQGSLGLSGATISAPRGHPGHLLRRRLRLRRRPGQARGGGAGPARRDASPWRPASSRAAPRRAALLFPGTIAAQRRDRGHERPAVQPDQAPLAGAGRLPHRPVHHRAVRGRDRRVAGQRPALAGHRRLGRADPRLAGRPGRARRPAVAAADAPAPRVPRPARASRADRAAPPPPRPARVAVHRLRARLARDALHGHAVAAVLRGAVLAADDAARPRGERGAAPATCSP